MHSSKMSDSDTIMGRDHYDPEDLWKRQNPIEA